MDPLRRQAEGHHTRKSVTTKECGARASSRVPLSLFVYWKKKKMNRMNYLALLIRSTTWISVGDEKDRWVAISTHPRDIAPFFHVVTRLSATLSFIPRVSKLHCPCSLFGIRALVYFLTTVTQYVPHPRIPGDLSPLALHEAIHEVSSMIYPLTHKRLNAQDIAFLAGARCTCWNAVSSTFALSAIVGHRFL